MVEMTECCTTRASHVSQRKRDMGHPRFTAYILLGRVAVTQFTHAASGLTFITRMSASLIFTGPTPSRQYQQKLLQRHSSGEATSPRTTERVSAVSWPHGTCDPALPLFR